MFNAYGLQKKKKNKLTLACANASLAVFSTFSVETGWLRRSFTETLVETYW